MSRTSSSTKPESALDNKQQSEIKEADKAISGMDIDAWLAEMDAKQAEPKSVSVAPVSDEELFQGLTETWDQGLRGEPIDFNKAVAATQAIVSNLSQPAQQNFAAIATAIDPQAKTQEQQSAAVVNAVASQPKRTGKVWDALRAIVNVARAVGRGVGRVKTAAKKKWADIVSRKTNTQQKGI